MKIGLFDVNKFYKKVRYEIPDIDLMKVYSYYKKNKSIVELSLDFKDYNQYDLYYIFNNKRHIVSKDLLKLQQKENVYLVGTCFYGDIWIPMDDEIEKCEPDIQSYGAFLRQNIIDETLHPWTERMFTDYYYLRYFYPDWNWEISPKRLQNKKVILYDFDITSNNEWKDLCFEIKQITNKNIRFQNNVNINTIDDLQFIIDNKLYTSGEKYPSHFVLNIPEAINDFKYFCDEYFNLLQKFPANSLFIYQNHYEKDEKEIERLAKIVDICMYFLSLGREIYPVYDYSQPKRKYDLFFNRVDYYFTMRKPGSIINILKERVSPDELLKELEDNYPIFYNKIENITRAEVKQKEKVWIYGER